MADPRTIGKWVNGLGPAGRAVTGLNSRSVLSFRALERIAIADIDE